MKYSAFNPYLPISEYVPDGEPHLFGDRLYVFGSHDKERGTTYCMLDYVGWSAPADDLSDWTCSGVIYSAKQDPIYGADGQIYMYAPDVVQGNDGRYYIYYCMAGEQGKGGYTHPVSVAVCDTPDGKYEYLGVVRDKEGKPLTRYICFDPAVINDDGVIRLYYGTRFPVDDAKGAKKRFFKRIEPMITGKTREELDSIPEGVYGPFHVELEEDMLTAKTDPVRILPRVCRGTSFEKHPFFEASSIRKIGNRYYFVYSSMLSHELCYAVSDKPDRDYTFGGTIVSNGDIGLNGRREKDKLNHVGNTHGGIECVNGQWYVFYHRITHHSDYSRQGCAEKITILPDGSIPQVEMTSCGLNDGPLEGKGMFPAVICCNLTNGKMGRTGNRLQKCSTPAVWSKNGERFIFQISKKTLIGYKYFRLGDSPELKLTMRGGACTMEIRTSPKGKPLAVIRTETSGKWREYAAALDVKAGEYPLYFVCTKGKNAELLCFRIDE